ncbi:MAG: hypothetical protein MUQ10_16405 [Anaerolineae bacterium]|nr:hypothetical protein [Anaerolineae bacterium]
MEKIITDLEAEVGSLSDPDPATNGWIPKRLHRIRMFAEAGEGYIPTSLLGSAGGADVGADLIGMTELLLALHTVPEVVHKLLSKIQNLFAATIAAGIEAADGEEYITTNDFPTTILRRLAESCG